MDQALYQSCYVSGCNIMCLKWYDLLLCGELRLLQILQDIMYTIAVKSYYTTKYKENQSWK